jgi:hypothetical protein
MESKVSAGYRRALARFTRIPKKYSFSYELLTEADKQILEYFEAVTVNYRVGLFYWKNFQEAYGAPDWEVGHLYSLGKVVKPITATGRSYKCILAGTSHASTEPNWPTGVNSTVADNGIIWQENTRLCHFGSLIEFQVSARLDYWKASVTVEEQ